jgi:hypothetical protein
MEQDDQEDGQKFWKLMQGITGTNSKMKTQIK